MNTIKEVYEQCLENGWLGTEKARIKEPELGLEGILSGYLMGKFYWVNYKEAPRTVEEHEEVEWIGNKPKTKKLYAALIGITSSKNVCKIEWFAEKRVAEDFGDFVEWLPEDDPRFAPIDLDSSPQSDQK